MNNEALFDFGQGTFLTDYVQHARKLTDAYPEYHISCGLSLLSLACQRKLLVNVTPSEKFTNLWMMNIGKPGTAKKTTAQVDIAGKILDYAGLSGLLHPEDFSRERLVAELSESPCNGLWSDEIGDFLAVMSRPYQAGLSQLLCKMYDCPNHYERKLQSKTFEVKNAYLPILSATTITGFTTSASTADMENGFYSRFLFNVQDYAKDRKKITSIPQECLFEREVLANRLKEIADCFKNKDLPLGLTVEQEALDELDNWMANWEKKLSCEVEYVGLDANITRMEGAVQKISALLWVNEEITDTKICVSHVRKAISLADTIFIPSAKRLRELFTADKIDKFMQKMRELSTKTEDGWVQRSTLMNYTHIMKDEFDRVVDTLKDSKLITEKEEASKNKTTGKDDKTKFYQCITCKK